MFSTFRRLKKIEYEECNMSKTAFIFLAILLLLPCLSFAQSGKVRGWITDKEIGDPIPDVKISVESLERNGYTDQNGLYVFLAVPPGEYAVIAECIGYQKMKVTHVHISSNLTTLVDFQLIPDSLTTETEISTDHQPILPTFLNTVCIQTQEDIQHLPFRGFQNIIALNPGTVLQDGELHIRGGRSGEVAYLINGANATNPLFNDLNVSIIQEAIQEIQMHSGGFTAEYGGANSAIVNKILRTGGTRLTGTLDFRTDNFVKAGNRFLETTSQGYHNVVATVGGPIPFTSKKVRFFLAGQYNYARNRSAVFLEPFTFDPIDKRLPLWSEDLWNRGHREFYTPWFVEAGYSGRDRDRSKPPRNAAGKVVPLTFERNFLPDNNARGYTGNGTLVCDVSNSIRLLLTGSYNHTRQPEGRDNFYKALNNYYSNTEDVSTNNQAFVNLRATHIINPTTYYDVGIHWASRKYENFDRRFGGEWWKYYDSRAWGQAGLDARQWQGVFEGPLRYSVILDFDFIPPHSPKDNYTKNSQTGTGGFFDFTTQLNRNIELKAGGRIDRWTMRSWSIGNIENYMHYLYGREAEFWYQGGRAFTDEYDDQGNLLWTADYIRRIELTRQGSIDYYGWDYDGETKVDKGFYGPRRPFFGSAYVQSKLEYRRLIVNLGLRWERIDYNSPRPASIEMPEYDATNQWMDVESFVETEPHEYLLPRISLAVPVSDNTVFHAQYGKYIQSVSLNNIYQPIRSMNGLIPMGNYRSSSVQFLAKPERTNHYELGLCQKFFPDIAFTMTVFYKEFVDYLRRDAIASYVTGEFVKETHYITGWVNNDFGASRGVELTFRLRRKKRLAGWINYTFSHTRGTGSSISSNNVVLTDVTGARFPSVVYPLNYDQTHRGSVMLDYRFSRGEGGRILEDLGCNLLFTFNSGHPYIKNVEPYIFGSSSPWKVGTRSTYDNRFRNPVEPTNSSKTPWSFNLDLTLDKIFIFGSFNIRLYMTVLNLLNAKNLINVYETTGEDDDDGWLRNPLAEQYVECVPGYQPFYEAINLNNGWAYTWATGKNLWGPPRQIRFGLMLEFK